MSVTLEEIGLLLKQVGIQRMEQQENNLLVPVGLEDGQDPVLMVFTTRHQGEIFELACVKILPTELVANSDHKAHFFLYLLDVAWKSAFGTPELDKRDGEVRLLLEIPLADAIMTTGQMKLILQGMGNLCKMVREQGRQVLETGEMPPETEESSSNASAATEAAARLAVMELVQSAKGRAMARQMLSDPAAPMPLKAAIESMLPLIEALDQVES